MAKLHKTFTELQAAITSARSIAKGEAGRNCGKGFLKSRGVWMVTLSDKEGLVDPCAENVYWGEAPTAKKFDALISDVLANHPTVDSISFSGGFDFAEQLEDFRDGGYDAWVSEWSIEAWRRPGTRDIDELVQRLTGFTSLLEMVEAHPNYRPTIPTTRGQDARECAEYTDIADAYDAAQAARGDARRAYRK